MSAIPTTWQQQVAERSQYRCSYCQSQQRLMGVSLTIDHIIPQSLGGATELDNLCLACWDCNLVKETGLRELTHRRECRFVCLTPINKGGRITLDGAMMVHTLSV